MSTYRNADAERNHIDYCLKLLGIRAWNNACQLIAKGNGNWGPLGPKWDLPIEIPNTPDELKAAGTDTMRLTAWQYQNEHPGSDLRDVLSQKKDFLIAVSEQE